jgi:hypothetical protein
MNRRPSDRSEGYVGQTGWVAPPGRTDLVDLVADEFERPDTPATETNARDRAEALRVAS